ncbi:MAG: hypothetical protein WB975_02600, partial [Nitrososphaeraceae archaeon]
IMPLSPNRPMLFATQVIISPFSAVITPFPTPQIILSDLRVLVQVAKFVTFPTLFIIPFWIVDGST